MKPLNQLTDEDFKNLSEIDRLTEMLRIRSEVEFNAKSVRQCMGTIIQLAKTIPKNRDKFYTIIFEINYEESINNYRVRYAYNRSDDEIDCSEDFIPITTEDYELIDKLLKVKIPLYGLCFICIKEKIYADEQLYYKSLWYEETFNNKVVSNNKYEYLGKLYDCSISNKDILKLNVRVFTFGQIIGCKIRELNFQYVENGSFYLVGNTVKRLTFIPLIDELDVIFRYNKIDKFIIDFRGLQKCKYTPLSLADTFSKSNNNEINKVEIIIDNGFFDRIYSDKRINSPDDIVKMLKIDKYSDKIGIEIKTEEK